MFFLLFVNLEIVTLLIFFAVLELGTLKKLMN